MTWFRRQMVLQWISLEAEADPAATAGMLADLYASRAAAARAAAEGLEAD